MSFKSHGLHGYSVKFSPYKPNRLASVACQQYGISGSSTLFIFELPQNLQSELIPKVCCNWNDGMFDVAWSEQSDKVCVTAGGDGTIQLWDLENPQHPAAVFKDHQKEVYCVDWSPNRSHHTIVSGSWDKTAKVWDPLIGASKPLATFAGHSGIVYSTIWSPHIPNCFASASGDGTLRVWDTRKTYMPLNVITAHNAEVLSCDWSKYDSNIIATGSVDGSIKIWDIRNCRQPVQQLHGHTYAVRRIRFSPHVAGILASCSYDFSIRTWNWLASAGTNPILEVVKHHTEFVYGLDFNMHLPGMIADCSWDEITKVYCPMSLSK